LIEQTIISRAMVLRLRRQRGMSKKSERAKAIIGAHHDYAQPRQHGPKRSHLAVTGSVGSSMKIDDDWQFGARRKFRCPDSQIEAIFIPSNVRKPTGRELRTGRAELRWLARYGPPADWLRQPPTQITDGRIRKRHAEKCHVVFCRAKFYSLQDAGIQGNLRYLRFRRDRSLVYATKGQDKNTDR